MTSSSGKISGSLSLRHIFGLRPDVSNNMHYLQDENCVLYPAGNNIVIYNTELQTQEFINGSDSGLLTNSGITALAVSPHGKYVAVAERGERATITIFDIRSKKKKKENR
eukprot:99904_1